MLTLDEIRMHLRIDRFDEDELLESLEAAAVAIVSAHLDNTAIAMDGTAPAPVKSATLLLIGDLYERRELTTDRPAHHNETFDRLLQPYRVMLA